MSFFSHGLNVTELKSFHEIHETHFITEQARSAVGQLNKLLGQHFFIPLAENLLCRRVCEAKNPLLVLSQNKFLMK